MTPWVWKCTDDEGKVHFPREPGQIFQCFDYHGVLTEVTIITWGDSA